MFSSTVVPFREGDVVVSIGEIEEQRIVKIDDYTWFQIAGHEGNWHNPSYWRLLRRPVRLGDQIVRPTAPIPISLEVVGVPPAAVYCEVQRPGIGQTSAIFKDGWQHANGVPVDWIGYTNPKANLIPNLNGDVFEPGALATQASSAQQITAISTDRLARELCRLLDEPYNRFVVERSEVGDERNEYEGGLERLIRTYALAWKRDEFGARTRWTDIARRLQNGLKLPR